MGKLVKPLESILFVSWCASDDPRNIQISQQCELQGHVATATKALGFGLDRANPAHILVLDCLYIDRRQKRLSLYLSTPYKSHSRTIYQALPRLHGIIVWFLLPWRVSVILPLSHSYCSPIYLLSGGRLVKRTSYKWQKRMGKCGKSFEVRFVHFGYENIWQKTGVSTIPHS